MVSLKRIDNLKLIQLVKEHELLYNSSAENYGSNVARNNAWKEIARIMGLSTARCKRRWIIMRDQYLRFLRKSTVINRKPSVRKKRTPKPYQYHSEMEFLKPYFRQATFYGWLPEFYTHNVRRSPRISDIIIENTNLNNTNDEKLRSESISVMTIPSDPLPTQQLSNSNSKNAYEKPRIIGSSSLVMEYANDKQCETRDVLTKYFETVAETVREFPPALQVKVKSEISKIVHQAEMEHIHQIQLQPYGQLINSFPEPEQMSLNNVMNSQYTVGHTLTKIEHPG
ncbi:uncharacterized protein LOC105680526 [Bombus impatiens]|uniref:Uncharacterized protein LOC105680526 n=1 Tax=Bombus impatiens TaxID=132113 RepID=A0A6P3UQI3_BOMIM|nr:uncharacterized protein LOC105680526 [Bombus impatiens]